MLPAASRLNLTHTKLTTKQTAEVFGKEKPSREPAKAVG